MCVCVCARARARRRVMYANIKNTEIEREGIYREVNGGRGEERNATRQREREKERIHIEGGSERDVASFSYEDNERSRYEDIDMDI